ncbi:MAG: T9SS type A sorting domain-containing protein [Saprospiraceae bacterium]|nr:T9SS type A sorting domain-containing protein [Saprospiraceae bacterium]
MNKIIQISFLWIIFTSECYAQLNLPVEPFEQIKWKNLSPKWHVTEYDDGMLSDSSDGYNYFFNLDNDPKRLYINGQYIFAYYLRGKRTSPSGHYIVKRNLETGEKLWSIREDHTMTGWRTNITRALFLDESSNLIHIGLVPISTYPKSPSGYQLDQETQLSKKIIDINSGKTIISYFPDNTDSTISIMPQAVFKYGPYNHLYKEEDNYRCFYPVKYYDRLDYKLVSQLVDSEGRRVGATDSIPFYEGQRFVNFTRISEDTFLYIETFKLSDSIVFNFVDKNLNTLKLLSINENFPINDMLLTAYQRNKLIFTSFDTKTDPFEPPISHVIYDLDGNRLLNAKVNLEYLEFYPIPLLYGKTDELFLFSRYAKKLGVGDWDFSMNVYKLLQDTMILISAFKVDDKDRFVFLASIDELPDGDILVGVEEDNMIYKNGNYQHDGNARAMSTMRVSPEALGLIPVSTNTEFIADQLNLYPNPSSGPVRIVFPNGLNEGTIEVYNPAGTLVQVQDFDKHLSNFFEFQDLTPGLYMVKAVDKNGKMAVGKMVVVE